MSQKFNVLQIHVDIAKILTWDIVISKIETFEAPDATWGPRLNREV